MNSAMMMQSPHRDVLEATPDSDESKAKLVEELQARGRAAVGAKSWMDAKLLYEKALTVCNDKERLAILNSNLSLVLKNMGSMEEARKAATEATDADPSYVKGWWRLGQALQGLHRSSEAMEALSKAKELEPTNKALIKELEKCQQKAEEEAKLMKEAEEQMKIDDEQKQKAEAEAATMKSTASITSSKPTTKETSKPATSTANDDSKMDIDNDDEKIFSKSDAVRGYKIVNGKKTSYFHNELSDEAKKLIGDIAPKKLDAPIETTPAADAKGGASAWNKAGTWEEKDLTKWATTTLKEHIEKAKYVLPESSPAPGAEVTVTKVSTLEGHASCALARGKKRYIYEFMAKLEWKLQSSSGLDCSGSLALPDIDGTIELGEGYEMHDFVIDSVSENSLRPLIERFVQRGGFHESLNNAIDDWVRRFKNEF